MSIHRILFRLDFKVNFRILNNPGEVMEIIDDNPIEDFWSNYRTNSQEYTVSGYYKSKQKDLVRSITVKPNCIVCILETVDGIEVSRVFANETFKMLLTTTRKICEAYKIINIQRSGLRLYYFNKIATDMDKIKVAYSHMFKTELTESVESVLGKITDYGIQFDGVNDDKINYHYKTGPCYPNEYKRYLEELYEQVEQSNEHNMICDLDLYEKSFSLAEISIAKWFQPLFDRAQNVFNQTESLIKNTIGE